MPSSSFTQSRRLGGLLYLDDFDSFSESFCDRHRSVGKLQVLKVPYVIPHTHERKQRCASEAIITMSPNAPVKNTQ